MTIIFPEREFAHPNGSYKRFGCFLDPNLKANIDNFLIRGIKQGHDGIVLVTGLEGSGKSSFTQLLAAYCDGGHHITLARIVFSGQELMMAIDNAKPEQAIIFDEAIMDMSSQDFATEMQRILIKKFTLIRKKRLFIFIVIPSIFMLRKYFAIFRTRAMINCYCPDGITRGSFRFYSFATKKSLYLRGMKEMDMGCVRADFRGSFIDAYGLFVNAEEYEKKKDEAIRKLTEDKETQSEKLKLAFEDYKLKLKIDVERFKGIWKDKFNELKAKQSLQLKEIQAKVTKKYESVKEQVVDLEKSKDKQKIVELDKRCKKLMVFAYNCAVLHNKVTTGNSTLSENAFRSMLMADNITNESFPMIVRMLNDGRDLIKLEQAIQTIK